MPALFDMRAIGGFMTSREPGRSFVDRRLAMEGQDGILSISVDHGFQAAAVYDVGSKVLVEALLARPDPCRARRAVGPGRGRALHRRRGRRDAAASLRRQGDAKLRPVDATVAVRAVTEDPRISFEQSVVSLGPSAAVPVARSTWCCPARAADLQPGRVHRTRDRPRAEEARRRRSWR